MKALVIIALVFTSCIQAFSQKSIILKGRSDFDLEYYFDDNNGSKMTAVQTNGMYELSIPKQTKFTKVTMHEKGNDGCEQTIMVGNLLSYSKAFKTDVINNDVSHLNSCFRMDEPAAPEYKSFVGQWGNADFELEVWADGEFYLKYVNNNIPYQKEGSSEVNNGNTLILTTTRVRNNLTETYTDSVEKIQFDLKDGVLVSEKLHAELRKIN